MEQFTRQNKGRVIPENELLKTIDRLFDCIRPKRIKELITAGHIAHMEYKINFCECDHIEIGNLATINNALMVFFDELNEIYGMIEKRPQIEALAEI